MLLSVIFSINICPELQKDPAHDLICFEDFKAALSPTVAEYIYNYAQPFFPRLTDSGLLTLETKVSVAFFLLMTHFRSQVCICFVHLKLNLIFVLK